MLIKTLAEAISMADKVVVLSKSPAIVKNVYKIELKTKGLPTLKRKDKKCICKWLN